MKKLILSAAAIFAFGFANAQDTTTATTTGEGGFSSGDIFISGSVGFNTTSFDESKSTTFNIAPRVGFFVADNIAIGGRLGYTSTKSEVDDVETGDTNEFSVGVFGRYYFTPSSRFSTFGEAMIDYATSKNELVDDSTVNSFGIAIAPGVSYFLSDSWAIEATWAALSFRNSKNADIDDAEATSEFGLNANLESISLGLIYKF